MTLPAATHTQAPHNARKTMRRDLNKGLIIHISKLSVRMFGGLVRKRNRSFPDPAFCFSEGLGSTALTLRHAFRPE
jgi:hypothetical protein